MKYPSAASNSAAMANNKEMNGHNHSTNGTVLNGENSIVTKSRNLDGYVGFVNLPNQVYRKAVKKGFDFNLMVIGKIT